jgi:hypothetical protein
MPERVVERLRRQPEAKIELLLVELHQLHAQLIQRHRAHFLDLHDS